MFDAPPRPVKTLTNRGCCSPPSPATSFADEHVLLRAGRELQRLFKARRRLGRQFR